MADAEAFNQLWCWEVPRKRLKAKFYSCPVVTYFTNHAIGMNRQSKSG